MHAVFLVVNCVALLTAAARVAVVVETQPILVSAALLVLCAAIYASVTAQRDKHVQVAYTVTVGTSAMFIDAIGSYAFDYTDPRAVVVFNIAGSLLSLTICLCVKIW